MLNFIKSHKTAIATIGGVALLSSFFLFANSTQNRIIKEAKKYIGVRELGKNQGFNDKSFEKKIRAYGWRPGDQWCAFFVRLVVLSVFKDDLKKSNILKKMLSGSTQLTWKAFVKNQGFWKVSSIPTPGAIICYQSFTDATKGHFGLVYKVEKNRLITIEGNSMVKGIEGVNYSERPLPNQKQTMRLLGFIKIL